MEIFQIRAYNRQKHSYFREEARRILKSTHSSRLLTYLDLSILKLEFQSDRFPMPLFTREDYNIMSKLINERPQSGEGSIIVTGQPETGEVFAFLSTRI